MKTLILCAISIGATLTFANAANAERARQAQGPQVLVKVSDLDMHGEQGRTVFRSRLARGVAAYCGPAPSTLLDLDGHHAYRACLDEATSATLAQVVRGDTRFAQADIAVRRDSAGR